MHVEAEVAVTEEIAKAIAPAISIAVVVATVTPRTPVTPRMGGCDRKGDQSTECGGSQCKFQCFHQNTSCKLTLSFDDGINSVRNNNKMN
jgi:hypothetical protein